MFYRFHKLYQEYSQQNQQLQGIRYQRQIDSFQVYPPTRDYSNYLNHDPSISRDIAIIIDCQNKYYQKNCHQITTNQEDLGQNSKSLKRQRKHVEEHDQFTEFRSHRLQFTANQEDLGQNSKSLKRQRKHVEEHDQFTEFRSHRLQSDEFSLSSVNLENSPKNQQSLTELLRAQLSDSPKNSHDLDLRSPSPSIKLESKEECAVEEYINSFLN